LLQYPLPLKPNPNLKFSKKYCQLHRERGHDTEDCNALIKEVERLLAQGYLIPFLKKDPSQDRERDKVRQQGPTLSEILIILGGSTTNMGVARNKRTRVGDQVLVAANQERFWYEPITFTPTDGRGIEYPHEYALVISTVMERHKVHRILVDNDSLVNIMSAEAMMKIGIDDSRMTLVPTPLIGIEGTTVPVKEVVGLIVIMGSAPCCVTLQ
jgi:hypothetical protein